LHPEFKTVEVSGHLLRLMVGFPGHSFLDGAIRDFFCGCLAAPQTAGVAVEMFAPVLMATADCAERVPVRCFALEMIGAMVGAAGRNPAQSQSVNEVPGMPGFLQRIYGPWKAKADRQYGGELKKGGLMSLFRKDAFRM
jgi:hypothetical protein